MRWVSLAMVLLLSGCFGAAPDGPDGEDEGSKGPDGADPTPPGGFLDPSVVTSATPLVNTGEPVAAWAPDGTIYVTFTGCHEPPAGIGHEAVDGEGCYHSPLYRSDGDGGWTLLLRGGRLHPDAPFSGGDTVVRVADDATVYVLYMDPDGLTLLRSSDRGETWDLMPRPREGTRDRPWLDVSGDRLDLVYRVGSALHVRTSHDRAETWSDATVVTQTHTTLSEIRHVDGCGTYVAFTLPHQTDRTGMPGTGGDAYTLHLAHRPVHGSWRVEDLPGLHRNSVVGTHFGEPMGFLALDVGRDCVPHIAWAQQSDPDGPSKGGSLMYGVNRSGWQYEAIPLGDDVVMPWLSVGAEVMILAYARDRVAAFDTPWDVRAARGPVWDVEVVDEAVHVGEFCTSNPFCVPTDRSLLDHLYLDLHPEHGLVAAYGAEPVAPDVKQMRVAIAPAAG